jgi:hypothetical protein
MSPMFMFTAGEDPRHHNCLGVRCSCSSRIHPMTHEQGPVRFRRRVSGLTSAGVFVSTVCCGGSEGSDQTATPADLSN